MIRAVYEAVTVFKPDLTHDQLLLINQWLDFYKKVPQRTFQQIKKEFNMELVETTISEHIFNQGLAKGKAEGIAEGLEQQITLLKMLHEDGVLSKSRLKKLLLPLETQLQALKH